MLTRQTDTGWVTDITCIRTMEGFAYLAVVIDLFSHRVVGWSLPGRQTSEVVLQALHMVVWKRKPQNTVLVHFDSQKMVASDQFPDGLPQHCSTATGWRPQSSCDGIRPSSGGVYRARSYSVLALAGAAQCKKLRRPNEPPPKG
ncbi:putative transposase OrfB [Hartmannibacter diazotrophicus]|uniref:Putative transposase OrfB n=1 Tax=Hartmannibacter diazotrophicus TaxID=1482074 RepID=A0A2C9D8I3_9HYPH|nr:putative transposase OrfB [Hartmannibacter diazotrophicus]